jgi:uncharacterized protein YciI
MAAGRHVRLAPRNAAAWDGGRSSDWTGWKQRVGRLGTGRCGFPGQWNWSLGYGLPQIVSSAGLNAGGYNSGLVSVREETHGMWYAIEGHDGAGVLAQRKQARPEHLARLTTLRDAGRLLLAGPCPAIDAVDPGPAGFSGSIVIAEFGSLEEARTWANADPYVAAGVYTRVDVRPFNAVLP